MTYKKEVDKFWFKDSSGYKHVAHKCCVDTDGMPCEVIMCQSTTHINSGMPVVDIRYRCGICKKPLVVD